MKRVPLLPTLVVTAAIAVMIGLGLWQISRAQWKEQLLTDYRDASKLPPIAFPSGLRTGPPPLYRYATGNCLRPVSKRATAGENAAGEIGYVHVVNCATGAEGPGMAVEIGWSRDPNAKWEWPGGPVSGVIAPDREHQIRLVAASSPAGLQPSAVPSIEAISNNHRLYAIQWFLFALFAAIIYVLALRRRTAAKPLG